MDQDTRRELISKNLGIKPISHGQVYTFQIALPDSRKKIIPLEKRQVIEQSLLSHQSNLVSLVLRRTDAYDDDIEYELVYGADWLQIAQELEIEKVWAWVFDLTDEQMGTAILEMDALMQGSQTPSSVKPVPDGADRNISDLIDRKLQLATETIKNLTTSLLAGIRNDLDEKLKVINYKIDNIGSKEKPINGLEDIVEKLDSLQQKLGNLSQKGSKVEPIESPINLLEASDQELEEALKQVNSQDSHIRAAIEAVHYWRDSGRGLTFQNLQKSARAKTGSPHKIKGFADGTYNRLEAVAFIPKEVTG